MGGTRLPGATGEAAWDMTLRLLDTFSGIGGFSYAAERIVGGFETVAFVEREPYCQQILGKHWPNVPIYDDITTFNPEPYSADVVCGGFPCQDISTAGKQAGIKQGTRSGLFYELIRVVRLVQPKYVVLENVSAILANGLDTVLGELAEAGFDAEWACIPASAVGACHHRNRWWCVAYASGGGCDKQGNASKSALPNGEIRPNRNTSPYEIIDCNSRDAANTTSPRLERRWPSGSTAHRLSPDWRSYLSQPVLRYGDDGLSSRVAKLKALGNAVVPQVAAIPLARVRQLAGV
jgi:DNA (cytosine-5)-methyltransferase 1